MTTTITTRIAFVLALTAACAPARASDPRPQPQSPAGEGVICAWTIYTAVSEVGRQCFPGDDVDFQAAMRDSVARIDAYVLKNSKITPSDMAKFKREQGQVGAPRASLCQGDAVALYQAFKRGGSMSVHQSTDKLLARAGEPSWGACL
jgi:hypothetical protein